MDHVFFSISLIIVMSALFACFGVVSRQPIVVAYIAAGIVLGPWGLSYVKNIDMINEISHIGVVMLLFLAGIVLHPQRLLALFKSVTLILLVSSLVSTLVLCLIFFLWGFSYFESIIAGTALLFSSTILVIKLLPTTTLHQKRMGSLCIAILVAQDMLAIVLLLFFNGERPDTFTDGLLIPLRGIAFIAGVLLLEQSLIRFVMRKIEYYHEVLLLLALGWCFGVSVIAEKIGFSHEIGAFIAGLSLARGPLSYFLSEGLKFFRDFFLVLFFFTLGAQIDFSLLRTIWAPALSGAVCILVMKPLLYRWLFIRTGETKKFGTEIGVRLGQASEFSLIVAVVATRQAMIRAEVSQMIQVTTIVTMIVSSYITVAFFPSPLSAKTELKQD
jgi:Kef-type K+ transport system membrane component KefB